MTKRARLKMLKPSIPTLDLRVAQPMPPPPKRTDPFYSSGAWQAFRKLIINERGAECEIPTCRQSGVKLYVDHRVELRDGGAPLDRSNVQVVCATCHGAKTAYERARRNA
jgi:5-methylcytosine-specific restriction protein A